MPVKKRRATSLDDTPAVKITTHPSKKVKILVVLLLLLSIALVSALVSRYNMGKKIDTLDVSKQNEKNKKEVMELVKKVGGLIVLPSGETPTVATITDADGLSKNQNFYKGAQDGDKVLIYFKAQKAYIYSPKLNRLINVGPVYVDSATTSTTSNTKTEEKVEQLNIEIRNGSNVVGSASTLSNTLKKNKYFNVVGVENAVTSTYSKTILVDLSLNKKSELIKKLESELNVKATTTLPKNEKSSTADALIIVGK